MKDKYFIARQFKYIKMMRTHGSIQLSLSLVRIPGLTDYGVEFVLRQMNKDGNSLPPIKKVVNGILRYEKLDGEKEWIIVIKGSNGLVTAYFSSIIGGIGRYIAN